MLLNLTDHSGLSQGQYSTEMSFMYCLLNEGGVNVFNICV